MISRLRAWLCKPLLDELEAEHERVTAERQSEAYRLGHQLGWDKGIAVGQLQGQQMLLAELTRFYEERRADTPEVTMADIERARKGLVH